MLFEWDDEKDRINRHRHEMPLKAGIPVFDDINAIEFEDTRFNYNEDRYIIIGRDDRTKLLYVVYTERGKGTIRLISVRKATKHELRLYQNAGD